MPYITSVERIGREEGLQQGLQQMVIEALDERFEEVPDVIRDAVHQIEGENRLRLLHRQAIWSASPEEFQQALDGGNPQ